MKAGRTRSGASNIPLIWRLRLVLHGVRLSPFAHDDLTTTRGARLIAYRVTMTNGELIGTDTAPLEARVNIRAASFVLRSFGLHTAEMRTDERGALLGLALQGAEQAQAARERERGQERGREHGGRRVAAAGAAASRTGVDCRH